MSASADSSMGVWDLSEKKLYHLFEKAHEDSILSVAVTRDNKRIVSGSSDKTIGVWDLAEKKIFYRFQDAHEEEIQSIAVSYDSKYIVSGSKDNTIGLWDITERRLLHRFEKLHEDGIGSVAISSDSKYIVSGSSDKTIAVWDIIEKKFLFQFENAHDEAILSVALTSDNRCIISGSDDKSIRMWDMKNRISMGIDFLPLVHYISKQYSLQFQGDTGPPSTKYLTLLKGIHFFSTRWNVLNFIVFLLPNVRQEHLDFAINNKICLSLDNYDKAQLDYMLGYDGPRNTDVDRFYSYFFKNISSLLNLNSLERNKVISSISRNIQTIFQRYGDASFLNAFNSLFLKDPKTYLLNYEILPPSGKLSNNNAKDFIFFQGVSVDKKNIDNVVNSREQKSSLDYDLILYDCSYRIRDPKTLKLLKIFNQIDSEGLLTPATQNIVDLLWKNSKYFLWLYSAFYGFGIGLFTLFAMIRTLHNSAAKQILIPINAIVGIIAIFEGLEAASDLAAYMKDLSNYTDIALIGLDIAMSFLIWTDANPDVQSFFVSSVAVLFFTKFLLVLRVLDRLRSLIRMMIEVIKDMSSFLIVIIVYTFAFAVIFFQSRRAYNDDSQDSGNFGNDLMEMYNLIYNGGTPDLYYGVSIPFFILVTFLQALVLLNLIISIMGETYARVKENSAIFDLKEKIKMLVEIADIAGVIRRFCNFICCVNRRLAKRQRQKQYTGKRINNFGVNTQGSYLLVVQKYEVAEDSAVTIQELSNRINSLKSDLKSEVTHLESKIISLEVNLKDKISSMESEIVRHNALVEKKFDAIQEMILNMSGSGVIANKKSRD